MGTVKSLAKDVVAHTARNRFAWSAYSACGRVSDYLGRIYGHARWTRETDEKNAFLTDITRTLFPDLVVDSGPFKGLRYVKGQSIGSTLLPKLIGSYESELHPVLESLLKRDYRTVIDVGCAEGYYAVGIGIRLKKAQIYAFDTDPRARQRCEEMARLNGISDRIYVGGLCDEKALRSIQLGSKSLIISDCEGYEKQLFTPEVREVLIGHDLIIETHAFINIDISQHLRAAFADTHHIKSIKSTDDIEKAHRYEYAKLARFDAAERRLILAERRPAIMEWLVMTPCSERNAWPDC